LATLVLDGGFVLRCLPPQLRVRHRATLLGDGPPFTLHSASCATPPRPEVGQARAAAQDVVVARPPPIGAGLCRSGCPARGAPTLPLIGYWCAVDFFKKP
jgi:hypothetical protein